MWGLEEGLEEGLGRLGAGSQVQQTPLLGLHLEEGSS